VKQKYNSHLEFLGLIPNRMQTTSPRQRDNLKSLAQRFGMAIAAGVSVSSRAKKPASVHARTTIFLPLSGVISDSK